MLLTQLPPPMGGIQTWALQYIAYCEKNDISLEIINNGLIGARSENYHSKSSLPTEIKRMFKVILSMKRKIKSYEPDIIHFNTACSPKGIIRDYLYACVIPKRIPFVLHIRCTPQDQLKGNKLGLIFFSKVVKKAARVLVLNKASYDFVKDLTGVESTYTSGFIAQEKVITQDKEINDTIKKLIFTGHIMIEKGCNEIIEAAKNYPKYQFQLIGQKDEFYDGISFPENVEVINEISSDEVIDYLDKADIYIFPSYTEGFSNSILEAMARGLPVISANSGASEEMIEDKGGIVVPIADSNELINAIEQLEDKTKRQICSKWNVNKISSEYIVPVVMKKYFEIYSDVIKERR